MKNCLECGSLDDYYKLLEAMTKEELETEFRKNSFLKDKIKRTYNIIRSRVFVEFVEVLNEASLRRNQNSKFYLDKIKESIFDCIQWCDTYSTIFSFFYNDNREADITSADDCLLENVKDSARICFKYANALLDFLVLSRNSAAYLNKKLFNESSPAFDKMIDIDGELAFNNQEDVEKFERNNLIEKTDNLEDIARQLQDNFYFELDEIDESFNTYADMRLFDKK